MNDNLVVYLHFAPAACVSVIGLVLAVGLRRRLGRVAGLAICAFTALSAAKLGSMILLSYISDALAGTTADELGRIIDLADRVQTGLTAASVVGFALLLAAVLTGPGRTGPAVAAPPPDSAEAP